MSNRERSRSPRYRREFSLSSLSSFEDIHTSRYSESNKFNRDRNNTNHNSDKGHSRKDHKEERIHHKKKWDKAKHTWSIKDQEKEFGKYLTSNRAESPEEESYLKPASSLYKEHEVRVMVPEKSFRGIKHEESMQDPSTCNFHGSFHSIDDSTMVHEESTKIVEERKKNQDETCSRLERLEKLVALLAESNTKPQSTYTDTSQENSLTLHSGVPELIPRNTDFTTSMWLNKIQDECVASNFDEKTSIQFVQSKMTGLIKAWFKTVSSYYDFTWPELKMLIIKSFPDNNNFASTLKLLVERMKKPDETVTQYYFSKMYLLEACKISGVNAVSCLIDGLDNALWEQEAKSYNFFTPEALYSQFLSKFVDLENNYFQQQPYELLEVNAESNKSENNLTETYNRQTYKKKICYTCNKFGHIAADCRHAPLCYNCQNKGHIAANCPLKNQVMLMSLHENEIGNCNFVLCEINGNKLEAYVDTGCSTVTIKKCVAEDLKLVFKPTKQIIWGFGGSYVRAVAEVSLNIKLDLVECILSAVVVPDNVQTVPVIIGQSLVHDKNVVTILCNNEVRLFTRNQGESHLKDYLKSFLELEVSMSDENKE